MKQLMSKPFVWFFFVTIFTSNSINAQKIIDSTTDFDFEDTRISELIKLREAFLYKDSITSRDILAKQEFKKSDSCSNCYTNTKSGRTIEFGNKATKGIPMKDIINSMHALVFRGKSKDFAKALEDFVRLQKANENLSVDEYDDPSLIGFCDIYQEVKFFVNLRENDYCLVIL